MDTWVVIGWTVVALASAVIWLVGLRYATDETRRIRESARQQRRLTAARRFREQQTIDDIVARRQVAHTSAELQAQIRQHLNAVIDLASHRRMH